MLHAGSDPDGIRAMFENFSMYVLKFISASGNLLIQSMVFSPLSMLCHIPWATPTLQRLPLLSKGVMKLRKFAVEYGTSRIKKGAVTKDLWYHLVSSLLLCCAKYEHCGSLTTQSDEAGLEKEAPPVRNVIADGALAMIAGSDTTATGMSNLIFLLLCHPESYKHLQAEIDDIYPKGENALDSSKHSRMPYLTACM